MQNNDVKKEKRKVPFEPRRKCRFGSAPSQNRCASASFQNLRTFSVPPHLLCASRPSQHLRAFSAHPHLLSTSRLSQHLRTFPALFQNQRLKKCWEGADMLRRSGGVEKVRRCWEGPEALRRCRGADKARRCWEGEKVLGGGGVQICTFPLGLNASLKTRFILSVAVSFDKWRVQTRFQNCVYILAKTYQHKKKRVGEQTFIKIFSWLAKKPTAYILDI
jgi:hypothetical protein